MRQARAIGDLHILEHSLVAAKMSVLRNKTTATLQFRRTLEQIAILLFDRSIKKVADRQSQVVLPDPVLATGRSATEAATLLKVQGQPIFNLSARSESNNCETRIQISRSIAPQSIRS